jgi:hypothetical protein
VYGCNGQMASLDVHKERTTAAVITAIQRWAKSVVGYISVMPVEERTWTFTDRNCFFNMCNS